jgi:hypothetical protein
MSFADHDILVLCLSCEERGAEHVRSAVDVYHDATNRYKAYVMLFYLGELLSSPTPAEIGAQLNHAAFRLLRRAYQKSLAEHHETAISDKRNMKPNKSAGYHIYHIVSHPCQLDKAVVQGPRLLCESTYSIMTNKAFPPIAALFLTHFDDIKGQTVHYYTSTDLQCQPVSPPYQSQPISDPSLKPSRPRV